MSDPATDQLRHAVESMHSCRAALAQMVRVRETFEGQTVWEGVVHVFDLEGHPKATRAYAWSSRSKGARIDGSSPRYSSEQSGRRPRYSSEQSGRRWTRCGRRSWRSIEKKGHSREQSDHRVDAELVEIPELVALHVGLSRRPSSSCTWGANRGKTPPILRDAHRKQYKADVLPPGYEPSRLARRRGRIIFVVGIAVIAVGLLLNPT